MVHINWIEAFVAGVLAVAFAPRLGRWVKNQWVKETSKAKKVVYSDYDTAKTDVEAEVDKIKSKL